MIVFFGQIFGKWEEGGWIRVITFTTLFIGAHLILISPLGYRDPRAIHRIVREKARVQGGMGSIVEWQALKMQEYRYEVLVNIVRFFELFGIRRPVRFEKPVEAGTYDHALHPDHPDAPSFLEQYLGKELETAAEPKPSSPTSASDSPAATEDEPSKFE
jgi:hypothetical protein